MINNNKCAQCFFAPNCVVRGKLKPFSKEAKKDLGVVLTMEFCEKFQSRSDSEET